MTLDPESVAFGALIATNIITAAAFLAARKRVTDLENEHGLTRAPRESATKRSGARQ